MKKLARLILKETDELNGAEGKFTARSWSKIIEAKAAIDNHPNNDITPESLGAEHGISSTTLKNGISAITGMAFQDYRKYRMFMKIGRDTLELDQPVKYFVNDSGYTSSQSFARGFRRLFWCTPNELCKEKWGSGSKDVYVMPAADKYKYGTMIAQWMVDKLPEKNKEELNNWIMERDAHMQLFDDLTDDNKSEWTRKWFAGAGIDHHTIKWNPTGGWYRPDPELKSNLKYFYWTMLAGIIVIIIYCLILIYKPF